MATLITKNSSTAAAVPGSGDLVQGELAVNVTDKKLYTKDAGGSVVKVVGSLGNQESNAANLTGPLSINGAAGTSGQVLTSQGAGVAPTWSISGGLTGQTDSASPFETSLGFRAGNVNSGLRCTFVGYDAGKVNSNGADVCAVGFNALVANNTGSGNIAVGSYALTSNTTGSYNAAVGYEALKTNVGTDYNCAFGFWALLNATAGSNSAFGVNALSGITSGSSNTAVGFQAAISSDTNSNITVIGANANPSTTSVSNEITLGNASVTTLRCATTTITSLSDERDKKNIIDLPAGLSFINAVRPVAFDWHTRDGAKVDIHDTGFLAQNLQQVQTQMGASIPGLVYDSNPEKLEAGYSKLLPVLVKAIQELSAEVEALKAQIG